MLLSCGSRGGLALSARLTLAVEERNVVRELIQRGWTEHQAGRLSAAKILYKQALIENPRHPDALNLLGVVALLERDPGEAARLFSKAIEVQPSNAGFHGNLAQAFLELRRLPEAHGAFRRAARLDPRNPQFAVGAAVCLAMQGQAAEAEDRLRAVLGKHPRYVLGWYNLGNVLRDVGRSDEAAESYRQAIRLDATFADAHNDLGRLLHLAKQFDGAEQAFHRFIELDPASATGYMNLASALLDRGRPAEAATVCRRGIALQHRPDARAELHRLLGSALVHQGDCISALKAFREAAGLDARNARALRGWGAALIETGRVWEGLRLIETGVRPETIEAGGAHDMAGTHLAIGNWQAGWRDYLQRPARARFVEKFSQLTLATESLDASGAVLVLREQGLGDELFFLRFTAELRLRGAALTYCTNPKLVSLLARARGLDRVIAGDSAPPADGAAVLVGDLPHLLSRYAASPYAATATRAAHFPFMARVFYPEPPPPLALSALPQQLADMKRRLSELGPPPYLGLTWRAGTAPEQQGAVWMLHKEIPLEPFGTALRAVEGTLLALQRHPRAGEIEQLSALARKRVHDLTALNEDLEAMLALLAHIDEYVGVSNTNMHLRAGVGRTARVLVPRPAEWRWLVAGDESPWFPGFRIYRQRVDGTWGAALERLERELNASYSSSK
jgi:Flp pilus assembly protein TadD